MLAPPGIPAEQVKILRAAYAKAINSPDLIAEAKRRGFEPALIPGDALETLSREVLSHPPEIVASLKKVMGE